MLFGKKKETDTKQDIAGKRVLVIGAGRSGIGSVRLLNSVGAHPVLLEENKSKTPEEIRALLAEEDRAHTEIVVGALSGEEASRIELVVPSPGVPADAPVLQRFLDAKVPVISELELAYRFMKGALVAITGTNGKTTTTSLTGEVLRHVWPHGADEVFVAGNIGESFAGCVLQTTDNSITVLEVSSFQLEFIDTFHADVSALLNITPDHLDRHGTMEHYEEIKERITNRQTRAEKDGEKDDWCVLNHGDPRLRRFGEDGLKPACMWFSPDARPAKGFYLDGDRILYTDDGDGNPENDRFVMQFSECRLKGICNAENVMTALAITHVLGFGWEKTVPFIREFRPVAHRIEYLATKGGVDYYNDSKATNPDSAIQGIRAMDRPTILIGGGYDKHSDFDAWTSLFEGRVKELVLIGETADAIEQSARRNGFTDIHRSDTFEEALAYCTTQAGRGDAVLLSPACASWGMFKDYEERGDRFREYVTSLTD